MYIVDAACPKRCRRIRNASGILCKKAVGDDLPHRHTHLTRSRMDAVYRLGIQHRLAAEGHDRANRIGGRDLPHRVGSDIGIDMRPAGRMLSLRAMSAASRTGICDDELDLLQILKAGIQWLLLIQEG